MAEEANEKTAKKKADNVKIGAVIVLVISALVFIPTGGSAVIQSIMQKNQTRVFGKYKGQKIEYKAGSDFAANVSNIAQNYQSMGYDVNQIYSYIFESAFETTVKNMYFEDAVKGAGYSVPKAAVNRLIIPYFRDENGEYSSKIYNQTDEATKSELRASAEESLLRSRFSDDVFGSNNLYGLKVSSKENLFISSMGTEKHAFKLMALSTSDLPKEEAVKYAENNKDTFRLYNFSAVTLSEKADAENILKQIQGGELTFDDAAKTISEKLFSEDDGKLSNQYYYQLKNTIPNEADLQTVTGLSTGAVSDVIQTSRGYTIFRCDGAYTSPDMTKDETIDIVLSYIKSYEISYIENYYTEMANKFIYDASIAQPVIIDVSDGEEGRVLDPNVRADQRLIAAGGENIVELDKFESACRNYGVKAIDVPAFPVNYGNSAFFDTVPTDVSQLSSLSSNASAFKTMFSLKENEISSPFVLGSNVIVAKCVSIEKEDTVAKDGYVNQASDYDYDSAMTAIMSSPDLVNDFYKTFYNSDLFAN
ncbi:MAG: peptidyl-prolyl cis-trans isomerase [Treponema sp.]|nr:peptidyl-prolyl cis-trans isomerase [Treponema sp.]MBQ4237015.1 peptidyl-prolyl cis-trans isomerase [Treponema sp.]MBQ5384168.1 peptidyl-prolyl cis-trans isomerase [Treponema sp.]